MNEQNLLDAVEQLIKDGVITEIGNANSDLQIPACEETIELVENYDYQSCVSRFNNIIDGTPWIEINFIFNKTWGTKMEELIKETNA